VKRQMEARDRIMEKETPAWLKKNITKHFKGKLPEKEYERRGGVHERGIFAGRHYTGSGRNVKIFPWTSTEKKGRKQTQHTEKWGGSLGERRGGGELYKEDSHLKEKKRKKMKNTGLDPPPITYKKLEHLFKTGGKFHPKRKLPFREEKEFQSWRIDIE